MVPYVLRRLAWSGLAILALLSVVFFLIHLAPGDPLAAYQDPTLGEAERAQLRHSLGLDRSLPAQYAAWLGSTLRGDLGRSLRQHRPVAEVLGAALPPTLLLAGTAYLLHLAAGICGGVLMARHRGRPAERAATVLGLAVYSLPSFWLGLMAIMVFSRGLGWFPSGGMQAPDAEFMPWAHRALDLLHHLALPALLLGLGSAVATARYLRGSVVEALESDFVLVARARGLPERVILWRHALRNGLLPVITLAGLGLPSLLGGALVTEVVFAWPGMGRVTVEAIWARDYPVVMATTALAAVMVVVGNLAADLLLAAADPRIRLPGAASR